jgi:hypothetical protein
MRQDFHDTTYIAVTTSSAWYNGVAEGAGAAWPVDVDVGSVLLRLQGGDGEVEIGDAATEGERDDVGGARYVFT